MPEAVKQFDKPEMAYHTLNYQCVKCKRSASLSLPYMKDYKGISYEKKGFCSNRYCEAQVHLHYSVSYPKQEFKLKVIKFLVDNEEKKVQIL